MPAVLVSMLTFISTFSGGLVGIRFRDRLHLILGFTAGVLLGVVFFDIMPEIMSQVKEHDLAPIGPMIALVIGFLLFHSVEKLTVMHSAHEEEYSSHHHPAVGIFSALALSAHSFLDGVAIGLGFQVSSQVGILIAVAVVAHDFADGLNTVSIMLLNRNNIKRALAFLFLDAAAPVLGVISTIFFKVPDELLVIYLGFFAGFLLYIGGSDILPEAHSKHSSTSTLLLTFAGALLIFVVTRLA